MLLFLVAGKSGCLRKGQGAQWLQQEAEQGWGGVGGGEAELTGGICRQLGQKRTSLSFGPPPPHQREAQRARFPFRVSQRQLGTLPPRYPGNQTSVMAKPHLSPAKRFIFP